MWTQVEAILRQAMTRIAEHIANALPGVLVALILVVGAFLAAAAARALVVQALRGLDFDRRAEHAGFGGLVDWSGLANASDAAGRVIYWAMLVLGLLLSMTALNATLPSQLAMSVFQYVPDLLAALMILVVGAVAAQFLSRSALIGAVNMQLRAARLFAMAVKWLVLLVAVAMALDHLHIGRSILLLAFGILFGGVVLAAALAVGLGARDAVSRALERQMQEPERRDEPVNHV
ncbi:MAG: hypothetical protein FJW23_11085 [Acidimicrobiia bacterium]|nr:hypothetical protein [Acidimicrobiia bacterium]